MGLKKSAEAYNSGTDDCEEKKQIAVNFIVHCLDKGYTISFANYVLQNCDHSLSFESIDEYHDFLGFFDMNLVESHKGKDKLMQVKQKVDQMGDIKDSHEFAYMATNMIVHSLHDTREVLSSKSSQAEKTNTMESSKMILHLYKSLSEITSQMSSL